MHRGFIRGKGKCDMISRRRFVATSMGGALMAGLAACSGDNGAGDGATATDAGEQEVEESTSGATEDSGVVTHT